MKEEILESFLEEIRKDKKQMENDKKNNVSIETYNDIKAQNEILKKGLDRIEDKFKEQYKEFQSQIERQYKLFENKLEEQNKTFENKLKEEYRTVERKLEMRKIACDLAYRCNNYK